MKRISTNDLRSAADRLIFEKDKYCREFKRMTPKQVQIIEDTLELAHDMLTLAAQKIKETYAVQTSK